MAWVPGLEYVIGAEAILILALMVLNLYFLSKRPILARLKEIFFINGAGFRAAVYLLLIASTLLVSSQALTLLTVVGVQSDVVGALSLLLQFAFATLLIVSFAIIFRIFKRYVHGIPTPDAEVERLIQADMRRHVLAEDTVRKTELDLTHVGDVYTGRKRLGPYVSLTHYRGLMIGFTSYTEERLGQLGDAILYSVGRLTARSAMLDILLEHPDREQALRRVFDEIRANGIGIPEVVERTERRIDIRLYENATSAGVEPGGKAICHYQSGMLTGLFEVLTGQRILSHEVMCWGLGDRFCEFQLEIVPT